MVVFHIVKSLKVNSVASIQKIIAKVDGEGFVLFRCKPLSCLSLETGLKMTVQLKATPGY